MQKRGKKLSDLEKISVVFFGTPDIGLQSLEYFYKRPLVFAEKGDKILLNTGVKTGILDIKNIKKPTDFKDFVYEVAAQNEHIRNHGSLNTYV